MQIEARAADASRGDDNGGEKKQKKLTGHLASGIIRQRQRESRNTKNEEQKMGGFYTSDKRLQKWYHDWIVRGVQTGSYRYPNRGMLAAQLRLTRKRHGNQLARLYSRQLTWVGAYPV